MKLYLEPSLDKCANGGIRRVVEAQHKYLPEFGIEFVTDPMDADVEAAHVIGKPKNPNAPFVLHNHGLLWRNYNFPQWAEQVNSDIVDSMRYAYAITSPSKWVTKAINRGVYFPVETIYHGVDIEEWYPMESHSDYVLWNKARTDEVSDPKDMQELAKLLPEIQFLSTFGQATENVRLIGKQSNDEMRAFVANAGIYLCTARETFGIGTLEALACGVPVVGWDYGGQSEIILHGETGYLVPFGDFNALSDAVQRALGERERLSRNAVMDVRDRWQWKSKIEQYANLYKRAVAWYTAPRPKVSVIVPAHNLAKYLPYTLKSIQEQTLQDFECLIVDDCSTDETPEIARAIVNEDIRFRYLKTYENLKLSGVRNYGASKALGKYIQYVDADDQIPPKTLELLSSSLDQQRDIHIVYGSLDLVNEEGTHQRHNPFPGEFNWYGQMAHQNQVPTGAMMRREVIEQSGGWRTRQWRAEDAEFWARVTSFGYQAKKVTNEVTLLYRVRRDSKGSKEFVTYSDRDGNWLANVGWRSANSAAEGLDYLSHYGDTVPQPDLVPFGAQGKREGNKFWNVWHHQEPAASIILRGWNGKEVDTFDSIMGQYFNNWEIFSASEPIKGFPYVEFVERMEEMSEIKGKWINVDSGQMFSNDWLNQQLGIELSLSDLTPKDKLLLQYVGRNQARTAFRVNSHTYYGSQGSTEWVQKADAEQLMKRGQWQEVKTQFVPAPQKADERK